MQDKHDENVNLGLFDLLDKKEAGPKGQTRLWDAPAMTRGLLESPRVGTRRKLLARRTEGGS